MKICRFILKRIIVAAFFLYLYNFLFYKFLIIPINLPNIGLISILGPISLIGLILFKILILWGLYEKFINC